MPDGGIQTKLKASPQILVSISQTKKILTGNFTIFEKNHSHSLITTSHVDETSKDNKQKATPQILVSISQTKKYLTGNFTNFEKFLTHLLITTPRVDETSKDDKTERNTTNTGEYLLKKNPKRSLITTPRIDKTSKDDKTESNTSNIVEYLSNKNILKLEILLILKKVLNAH